MLTPDQGSRLLKIINCQTEALNFVKQNNDVKFPVNIICLEHGQRLGLHIDETEGEADDFSFVDLRKSSLLYFYYGVDMDQFAPAYEWEVLRNLYTLRDKIDNELSSLEPLMDDYVLMLQEQTFAGDKFKAEAEKKFYEFWLLYRRVVSIVGGFLMLEHFDDCLPVMIKKYHICLKRRKLYDELSKVNDQMLQEHKFGTDSNAKTKKVQQLEQKVDQIQSAIIQCDRSVQEIDIHLDELRQLYSNDQSFQMHEKYRDKGLCLNFLTPKERQSLAAEIVEVNPCDFHFNNIVTISDLQQELTALAEGESQVNQQTEIQHLYNLLNEFIHLSTSTVSSCLSNPLLLVGSTWRSKYGDSLIKRRPKLIIWENVVDTIEKAGLTNAWNSLLNILAEHEKITNILLSDDFSAAPFSDICETEIRNNELLSVSEVQEKHDECGNEEANKDKVVTEETEKLSSVKEKNEDIIVDAAAVEVNNEISADANIEQKAETVTDSADDNIVLNKQDE